jgi:hypothetical protein
MSSQLAQLQEATIKQHCKTLRMPMMASQFSTLAEQAVREKKTHTGYLEVLLTAEIEEPERNTIERRIKEAHLPRVKTLEEFDYTQAPGDLVYVMSYWRGSAWRAPTQVMAHADIPPLVDRLRYLCAAYADLDFIVWGSTSARRSSTAPQTISTPLSGASIQARKVYLVRKSLAPGGAFGSRGPAFKLQVARVGSVTASPAKSRVVI